MRLLLCSSHPLQFSPEKVADGPEHLHLRHQGPPITSKSTPVTVVSAAMKTGFTDAGAPVPHQVSHNEKRPIRTRSTNGEATYMSTSKGANCGLGTFGRLDRDQLWVEIKQRQTRGRSTSSQLKMLISQEVVSSISATQRH